MGEFDLIQRYFAQHNSLTLAGESTYLRDDVILGIGDDAAITVSQSGQQLVTAIDTLVAGRHFHHDCPADAIGHKALAVNLSDLAAMGAEPCWATLAITLPAINDTWLEQFSTGFFALARQHNVSLIGGDTTQGPLTITVQVAGQIPTGTALRRNKANVGDALFVTGKIGLGAIGLQQYPELTPAVQHLLKPLPLIKFGQGLRVLATSCIDVSDGLLADLGHILTASKVGAQLNIDDIPLAMARQQCSTEQIMQQLSGGDDYQLCFTVDSNDRNAMTKLDDLCRATQTAVTRIGYITQQHGVTDTNGKPLQTNNRGYQHFV